MKKSGGLMLYYSGTPLDASEGDDAVIEYKIEPIHESACGLGLAMGGRWWKVI